MEDTKTSVSWWTSAIFCTGLLQDPVRKCLPGQPVVALLLFLVPAILGIALSGPRIALGVIRPRGSAIIIAGALSIVLMVATMVRLQKGFDDQSLQLLLLGWLGPGVALLGIVWGRVFCCQLTVGHRFQMLRWMSVLLAIFCLATWLEVVATDYESAPWLGPMPPKRPWYRTVGMEKFRMLCGLFRSPENAGWFSAFLLPIACLAISNFKGQRFLRWQAIMMGSAAWAVCLLAGRRKMQVMMAIAVFVTASLISIAGFRSEARRYLVMAAASVLIGCGLVSLLPNGDLYLGYSSTAPFEAPSRTIVSAWEPILAHSREVRWFGAGLGEMVPGRQYVGGSSMFFTEGGLVRVFVETGWFGLIVFSLTAFVVLWWCIRPFFEACWQTESPTDFAEVQLSAAATAIVIASLFCFLIGHQIFGDPFVTFLTGAVVAVALPTTKDSRELSR